MRWPLVLGENVTSILQVFVGARDSPAMQVVVPAMEKSPLLVMLFRIRGVVPVLVSVTLLIALVVPTFCGLKESFVGFSEAFGLMVVAFKGTVWGLPAALSVITNEALVTPS